MRVEDDQIVSVEVVEQHESEGITGEVWTTILDAIVKASSTGVDTISGANIVSNGSIEVVNDVLSQAKYY